MTDEVFKYGTGERGRWVYNRQTGEWVKNAKPKPRPSVHAVHTDERDAFINHVDGKVYTSMSKYRRALKEQGYVERGNDRPEQFQLPTEEERYREIRDDVLEAKRQVEWGVAESTSEERELWEKEAKGWN